jgi:hypothetical protein
MHQKRFNLESKQQRKVAKSQNNFSIEISEARFHAVAPRLGSGKLSLTKSSFRVVIFDIFHPDPSPIMCFTHMLHIVG